ncbi:MAG: hypothetical protein IJH64_02030 [Oscillospiraceae bacterium]|nr:hypothetical protein [Oscillospiraceae bacterium]
MHKSLHNAVSNIAQSLYDAYVEVNAKAKAKAGVKTVIIRRQIGHCCDWCARLSGIYDYNNAPKDIYRRHDNCRCMVTVRTDKGTYKDAWSKIEYKSQREARRARAEEISIEGEWDSIAPVVAKDKKATRGEVVSIIGKTKDVRGEYLKHSFASKGEVDNQRKTDTEADKKDKKCAEWLAEKLGFDVVLLPPVNKKKVPSPDFYLNAFKSTWEYKTVSSFNSIDNQIHDGCNQTSGEHCGIVIDIKGLDSDISLPEAIMAIRYRMVKRSKSDILDVLVKREDEFIAAFRFIKR